MQTKRKNAMRAHPHVLLAGCPVDSPVYSGVQGFAKERSWQLLVGDPFEAPGDWRGDGAILAGGAPSLPDPRAKAVRIGRGSGAEPCVAFDDEATGRLVASHYLERCFRHFAFFARRATPEARLREKGFRSACAGAGSYRAWFESDAPAAAKGPAAAAQWLESEILAAPKPLAVACAGDRDAMLVINACKIRGVALPDDVSIIGVGNHLPVCERECITLSSVVLDGERIGREAAALLDAIMSGRSPARPPAPIAPSGIVSRQSTDVLGADDPDLRRALAYISRSLHKPFGAAEISSALSIGRNRLDRLFATELGRSVGREILRQRLARARELLSTSAKGLDEIAAETGFCNTSYMIKRFRSATGLTPLEWRRARKAGV